MKHYVIIALGSNRQQTVHIQWASERLEEMLSDCRMSRTIWTDDIKGSGKKYLNRLVCGTTTLSVETLERELKQMEVIRKRSKELVTLDLDLMQYDQQRYHEKDWPRPYIQQLIPDLI